MLLLWPSLVAYLGATRLTVSYKGRNVDSEPENSPETVTGFWRGCFLSGDSTLLGATGSPSPLPLSLPTLLTNNPLGTSYLSFRTQLRLPLSSTFVTPLMALTCLPSSLPRVPREPGGRHWMVYPESLGQSGLGTQQLSNQCQ